MDSHSSDAQAFDDWDQDEAEDAGNFWQPGDDEDNAIDDWREGETLEQRNARLLAAAATARGAERPEGTANDPEMGASFSILNARRGREHVSLGELGHDDAAIRSLLADLSASSPFTFAELVAPTPSGRLPEVEQERRNTLACGVAEARRQGAMVEALGRVLGRPRSTINALESRGRALLGLTDG